MCSTSGGTALTLLLVPQRKDKWASLLLYHVIRYQLCTRRGHILCRRRGDIHRRLRSSVCILLVQERHTADLRAFCVSTLLSRQGRRVRSSSCARRQQRSRSQRECRHRRRDHIPSLILWCSLFGIHPGPRSRSPRGHRRCPALFSRPSDGGLQNHAHEALDPHRPHRGHRSRHRWYERHDQRKDAIRVQHRYFAAQRQRLHLPGRYLSSRPQLYAPGSCHCQNIREAAADPGTARAQQARSDIWHLLPARYRRHAAHARSLLRRDRAPRIRANQRKTLVPALCTHRAHRGNALRCPGPCPLAQRAAEGRSVGAESPPRRGIGNLHPGILRFDCYLSRTIRLSFGPSVVNP